MPYDQYLDNPALRPTILVSALKPVQRLAPARRAEPADEQGTRESPRAA
jgi:hypothetical protein